MYPMMARDEEARINGARLLVFSERTATMTVKIVAMA